MHYFLGVDSGGTKADFLLSDETRELARVRTGTIKRMKASENVAESNLQMALSQLTAISGVSMQSVTRCCIGTAGETVPLVVDWLRDAFGRYVGGELILIGDVEIALDSAFHGQRGVVVLAGTGSNVAGRAATGQIVTAGGWGPALADQGSGHFLGLESLRRGFLAIDRQQPSLILDAARTYWNLSSVGALIEFANANPPPEFSRLVPSVVSCAKQGDPVALEVLEQGGTDLANLVSLVIERIRKLETESTAAFKVPAVAVAGSILEHLDAVRKALESALRKQYPDIAVLELPADPPAGALWNARHRSISTDRSAELTVQSFCS